MLIELAKESSVKVSYVLNNIIFIHYGYLQVMSKEEASSNSDS